MSKTEEMMVLALAEAIINKREWSTNPAYLAKIKDIKEN